MQPLALGQPDRVFVSRLKIVAVLDKPRAKRRHRAVFLDAVAVGHNDGCSEPETACGIGDALPVIAAGGRHDAACRRLATLQIVQIDEPAAQFEGANRGVVFVLDPDFRTDPPRQ